MNILLERGPGDLLQRRYGNAFSDYYTASVQRSQSQRRRCPLLYRALCLICSCWLWAESWYLRARRKMNAICNAQRKNTASWKLMAKFISDLNQRNCPKNKLNPNNKARLIKATVSDGFTPKISIFITHFLSWKVLGVHIYSVFEEDGVIFAWLFTSSKQASKPTLKMYFWHISMKQMVSNSRQTPSRYKSILR